MTLATFYAQSTEDTWNQLQQPAHASASSPHLRQLLAALDQGWQIENPVYLRPRWGERGDRVYHFVLQRPLHGPRLITVPEQPAVDLLVRAENLRVIA
ncbi:MAG: hypothetical protein KA764_16370 [Anaerolineales bacterium]|nr:hypothetical protein [Anaerolineales bacterium]